MKSLCGLSTLSRQHGAAAVEFAIVASLLFTVLLGVMEMGRLLWTWNAAVEATRYGARLAVVCDKNDPDIKNRMFTRLPSLTGANITIDYLNPPAAINSCGVADCKAVKVSLTGYTHQVVIPFLPASVTSLTLPSFTTTLRREAMDSQANNNEVCQ